MAFERKWAKRRPTGAGSRPRRPADRGLLLFGLVATGQIRLRKIDGYTKLAAVIRQRLMDR